MEKVRTFSQLSVVLFIATVLLVMTSILINNNPSPPTSVTLLPNPSSTQTKYPLSSTPISETTKLSASSPTKPISTFTPYNFPTPFPGPLLSTNAPVLFRVESWKDNYIRCDNNPTHNKVTIYGVIISHGIPPFGFTFWLAGTSFKPLIKQTILMKNFRHYVEFTPPVEVVKGEYIHIELTFQREDDSQVTWIDDLYYPHSQFDPACR